jgi:ribosomal protein S18 acetylase RimI-like enzyme
MIIREFRESDTDAVLEIDRIFPPTSRDPITRKDIEKLSKNPKCCLVAEEENKIIGFIFCELQDEKCFVKFLQVRVERMGEGIAQKLIDKIVELTAPKSLKIG